MRTNFSAVLALVFVAGVEEIKLSYQSAVMYIVAEPGFRDALLRIFAVEKFFAIAFALNAAAYTTACFITFVCTVRR